MGKMTSFGMSNPLYMKTLVHIPALLEKAVFLAEEAPHKRDAHFQKYRYLVTGFAMAGISYTARIILGENQGVWYYSHVITEMPKEKLLNVILGSDKGHQAISLSGVHDRVLVHLLQGLAPETFTALDILDYVYAILHSPRYREAYREFLKIDFPRVPYPADLEKFRALAGYGAALRKLHLLQDSTLLPGVADYPVAGSNVVERLGYRDGKVWINEKQYFEGVPAAAWEFYVGGYQPAQKYLKDRKGRTLDYDALQHYQKVIHALCRTLSLQRQIDSIGVL